MRVTLLALLCALGALLAATANGNPENGYPNQDGVTTVFLVRHAERAAAGDAEFDPDNAADPPLNDAGRARADELARTLGEAGVTVIYATQFARTQQTVQPLANHLGLPVTVHDARDSAGLVELISDEHRGGVVVVAGHSNTVPELIEALGAPAIPPIEEAWEYDNLYVVTIDAGGQSRVSTLKYGARSDPASGRLPAAQEDGAESKRRQNQGARRSAMSSK